MKRPNPHGRSILLTAGLPPATEEPPPTPAPPKQEQRSPKPWRSGIPLHRGAVSDEEARRLDAEGKRRREGNCAVPSWQLLLPHGCMGCLAPTGIPPLEAGEARLRLEGLGWVFRGGMWLCAACDRETR